METRPPRPSILSVLLVLSVAFGSVAPVVAASAAGGVERATQAEAVEVTGLNAPTEATVGESIGAEATVRNAGTETATVTLQYRIDVQVVATVEVTLAAGESRTVTLSGTVPELDPGTYQQGVFVGTTENGRTASLTVRGSPVPVFAVTDFRGPAQARTGETVTAEAVVQNTGDAAGSTAIQYRIGEQVVATQQVSLAPGERVALTFEGTVPALAAGTYRQGVFVGDTQTGQTSSIVIGAREARFAVLTLQAPSEVQSGTPVSVRALVLNTGDAAGSTTLQYRIGDRVVATASVSIDPGASQTAVFEGTVPDLAAGTYLQGVFVGDTGDGLTSSVTVLPSGPSFAVTGLRAPPRATVGERVSATATVRNTGNARGSTRLEYRVGNRVIASRSVTLDAGASASVELVGILPTLAAGTYQQGVFVGGTDRGLTTSLAVSDQPAAVFAVSDLRGPSRAETNARISVRATVRNVGQRAGDTRLEYRIGNRVVARRTVELNAGRSTTVTFDVTVPDLQSRTYTQGVFVGDTDVGQTSSLRVTAGRPRITVESLQAPPSVRAGDRVSVQTTIRNAGNASGTRTVEYRIEDRVVAARDLRIDARESRTVTLEGTVPSLPAGTYRQGVFVGEQARTTSLEVRLRVEPRAEFVVGRIRAPAEATVGDRVTVEATVGNVGNASGSATLEYRIEERVVATRQVRLGPDEEETVDFDVTVPDLPTGTYLQGVYLAGTSDGEEADLFVTAGAPRFAVSDVRGPAEATAGDPISVRATVTNTGRSSGSTAVEYRIGDEVVSRRTVRLDPGTSRTLTFTGTVPDLRAGTYPQGVFVGNTSQGQTTSIVVETAPTPTPTSHGGAGFTPLLAVLAILAVSVAAVALKRRG